MEKPHKKLTFAYNNTKHRSTNYSRYFLLLGGNGHLPVDLMFDIKTNNDIKNKSHSDYIKNWQNAMKEVYSKIRQNNKILQETSKSNYDKKIFGSTLMPGETVLLKNLSEQGGTGKLKSCWENDIYEVVSCHPELPIYQIKQGNVGNKIRTVHRKLVMKCNDLPVETQSPYSTLSTSNQKPNKITNSNSSSDSSCSDSDSEFEYVLVKRKPKQQYISNRREVRGEDSNQEITPKEPESEIDKSETIEQPTRPKRNRKPKQIFTYDTLGKPSYHNT